MYQCQAVWRGQGVIAVAFASTIERGIVYVSVSLGLFGKEECVCGR